MASAYVGTSSRATSYTLPLTYTAFQLTVTSDTKRRSAQGSTYTPSHVLKIACSNIIN